MQRRSEVSARARGAVSRLQCLVKGGPRGLSREVEGQSRLGKVNLEEEDGEATRAGIVLFYE